MKSIENIKYNPITEELSIVNPGPQQTKERIELYLSEIKGKMASKQEIRVTLEDHVLYIKPLSEALYVEFIQTLTRNELQSFKNTL